MIVLARKKNESIVLGNNVVVTVLEIRGDRVRLKIEAPPEMPVHRQEVWDAIHGFDFPVPTSPSSPRSSPLAQEKISVEQLVQELGASTAEVDRKARFTNEGGIMQ